MTLLRLTMCSAIAFGLTACDGTTTEPPIPELAASFAPAVNSGLATGSAHVPAGEGRRVFTFHAKQDGVGGATGSYRIRLTEPGLFFEVDVSCMAVVGNTAWIAGHISNTNAGFIEVGSVSYFYAIDGGEGTDAPADVLSTARINDVEGEDRLFCQDRPLLLPSFPIEQGNIQVR